MSNFFLFKTSWTVFLWLYCFLCVFIYRWTLEVCLPILVTIESRCCSEHGIANISSRSDFNSFENYPEIETAGLYGRSSFHFWRISILSSTAATPFAFPPTSVARGSSFSASFWRLLPFFFLNNNCLTAVRWLLTVVFNLIFH